MLIVSPTFPAWFSVYQLISCKVYTFQVFQFYADQKIVWFINVTFCVMIYMLLLFQDFEWQKVEIKSNLNLNLYTSCANYTCYKSYVSVLLGKQHSVLMFIINLFLVFLLWFWVLEGHNKFATLVCSSQKRKKLVALEFRYHLTHTVLLLLITFQMYMYSIDYWKISFSFVNIFKKNG